MTDLLEAPEFALVRAVNPVPSVVEVDGDDALRVRIMQTAPRNHRRRPALIIDAAAVGVATLTGVAAAAGLIPAGVTRAFDSLGSAGKGVTDAHVVAQTTLPTGIRAQVWVGHNSQGGACEYTRVVAPNGSEDGGVGCFSGAEPSRPRPSFVGGLEAAGRPLPSLTYIVTAHTTLASVQRIVLVFDDGITTPLSYNARTGWAIGVVPPDRTTHASQLVAYDANGHVVAREHERPTTGRAPRQVSDPN
ncbi:MAG TPA: hypothetical protein VMH41_12370 [Mycobacteriales bacterium]|nr:hypothetical protein [Mycobacteriales bacterium]